MRTQSRDTSPEMEQVQIAGLRAFAPAKKFASVRSISASMHFAALQSEVHSGSDYERVVAFQERCGLPHPDEKTGPIAPKTARLRSVHSVALGLR